jgi:hypothetical protein
MYGGTKQGLSLADVKNYVLLLPPPEDQSRLVTWIEESSSSVDRSIGNASREIDLLREYRTRLVADVVTGKLDVREAAQLPDDVEGPEVDDTENEPDPEQIDESAGAASLEVEA